MFYLEELNCRNCVHYKRGEYHGGIGKWAIYFFCDIDRKLVKDYSATCNEFQEKLKD